MKIIDSFLFANELDLVELRFRLLNPVVDKFVVCECSQDFMGRTRELVFSRNAERFSDFFSKLEYSVLDLSKVDVSHCHTPEEEGLCREYAARDHMGVVLLKHCSVGDISILSDVDEIPTRESVEWYVKNNITEPLALNLDEFIYFLNNRHTLIKSRLCNSIVRYDPQVTPQWYRARRNDFRRMERGAGWHFSSCGDVSFISNKLSTYGLQNNNVPSKNNKEYLQKCIYENIDFTNGKKMKVEIYDNFPPEVYDLADKCPYLWKE